MARAHLVDAEERGNGDLPLISVEERDLAHRLDAVEEVVHRAVVRHDALLLRLVEHALVPVAILWPHDMAA